MAEVGTAFVSLLPSAKGFGRATEKQIAPEMAGAGKSVGSKFGSAVKVGALAGGAALALFGKSIITSGSEAQQSIGATRTVFGKFASDVTKTSGKAAQAYGLSANTYRENANLIGSLFKNQGVETDQLAGKTQQMIGIGADLAATFGGSTTDAVSALGSAFKGEFDTLERYGISLKESTVSALLAQRGQDKLTGSALAAAKQQAISTLIMEQSKDSLGAFSKESNTLAGQQQRLGASFDNIKATLGTALLPVLTRFAGFINTSILPAVTTFIAQMQSGSGAGGRFAAAFTAIGTVLSTVFGFLSANRAVVGAFVGTILAVVAALRLWAAVQVVLNAVLVANPIGLVVVAIAAFVAALVFAYKKSDTFRAVVQTAFAAVRVVVGAVMGWLSKYVPGVFAAVVGAVKAYMGVYKAVIVGAFAVVRGAISGIGRAWNAAVDAVGDFASGTKKHVSTAIGIVKGIPGQITGALGGLGSLLLDSGRELIGGLIAGIGEKLRDLRTKMSEVAGTIKGFLPGSPVKEGPLTSWNNGGAGKRLVGLLADGLSDTRPVDQAMTRLVSGATLPRKSPSLALAGVGAGGSAGGRQSMRLVVDGREFTGYVEAVADGRVRTSRTNSDMRRRAGGNG